MSDICIVALNIKREVSFIMARISSNERINDSISPHKNRKGGKGVLIGGIAATAVACIIVGVTIASLNNNSEPVDDNSKNMIVTPDNVDEVIESMENKKVPDGSYNCIMNPTWTFDNGSSASKDAYVENAATNPSDVYFTVTIEETGEEILKSPVIPLGSHMENITLDKVLPAGSYDCIITYHLIDGEENETSSVNLTLKIVIEQ